MGWQPAATPVRCAPVAKPGASPFHAWRDYGQQRQTWRPAQASSAATDQDRSLRTLDNQAFKRPLQALDTNVSGLQSHAHVDEGSFELAVMR